ncbi:MAG: shikimate dehydrogenase [Chloroflexota bacterium]
MNINGKTNLIGLIGWPVSHSFSPRMHNAAAADLGLNWVYVPLPVRPDDVETAVLGLGAAGFRGINITVPHKQAIIPLLDVIEAGAQAIGAVNTIVFARRDDGRIRLIGHNTDWSGFLADLEAHKVAIKQRDCLVLGAGGSARAVVYALIQAGGQVQVFARRLEQAQQLVADLAPHLPADSLAARDLRNLAACTAMTTAPLIVNTTPLGMTPNTDSTPWPKKTPFPKGTFVYDLVYNPATTNLMRQAQSAGVQAVSGLGMLVQQGAIAFRLWTGQMPNVELMRRVI